MPLNASENPRRSVPLPHIPLLVTVPEMGRERSSEYVQVATEEFKSMIWTPVPSGSASSASRSGRGMQNVTSPAPVDSVPEMVKLMTPGGAAASGQSLLAPAARPPKPKLVEAPVTISPNSGASAEPQTSPPQPIAKTLVVKRKCKRDMKYHRIAESVVLNDILPQGLDAHRCPSSR